MSVKVRPYRRGGWEVDITVRMADGRSVRERVKAPVSAKSAARRWGEARERHLLLRGAAPETPEEEAPTLAEFAPRYLDGYARANRQKPSGVRAKETILAHHLIPRLGDRPLDRIGDEQVQALKAELSDRSSKTVNNVLSTLNTLLKVAVEWGVLSKLPCTVRLLKVAQPDVSFYDFDEFEALLDASRRVSLNAELALLLGGEAGLRLGEIVAVEQIDIDHRRRSLVVQRAEWQGHVGLPKGGRIRRVPMTRRLASALARTRHLRGPRVLYRPDGRTITRHVLRNWLRQSERRAGLPARGALHALRHTFCSHLAMRGAPARAIQELAGHKDLQTTQRYMHLSPQAVEGAIRLLDRRGPGAEFGDILETDGLAKRKASDSA